MSSGGVAGRSTLGILIVPVPVPVPVPGRQAVAPAVASPMQHCRPRAGWHSLAAASAARQRGEGRRDVEHRSCLHPCRVVVEMGKWGPGGRSAGAAVGADYAQHGSSALWSVHEAKARLFLRLHSKPSSLGLACPPSLFHHGLGLPSRLRHPRHPPPPFARQSTNNSDGPASPRAVMLGEAAAVQVSTAPSAHTSTKPTTQAQDPPRGMPLRSPESRCHAMPCPPARNDRMGPKRPMARWDETWLARHRTDAGRHALPAAATSTARNAHWRRSTVCSTPRNPSRSFQSANLFHASLPTPRRCCQSNPPLCKLEKGPRHTINSSQSSLRCRGLRQAVLQDNTATLCCPIMYAQATSDPVSTSRECAAGHILRGIQYARALSGQAHIRFSS